MLIRAKFSKYGTTKFIGHLDVMRYFQKAIRRSGLNVVYSNGFHPHQLLYFAAPLGLGQTSDAEYMDAEFAEEYTTEEIKERLNAVMTEGFEIREVSVLSEWKPNTKKESIMSLTACADYMVSVKDMPVEYEGVTKPYAEWLADWQELLTSFCAREQIIVKKESKKSSSMVNIRPMLYAFGFTPDAINPESEAPEAGITHAESYENGKRVFFKLSSGSVDNLKPELILESCCMANGLPYQESALQFHRMETYCDLSTRGMNNEEVRNAIDTGIRGKIFVPLIRIR